MQVEKTAQGKVKLYPADGGEPVERWPVDARGMIASGEFSATPVEAKKGSEAAEVDDSPEASQRRRELAAATAGEVTFDPIKTPSMDPVAGATSPLVPTEPGEAILGAGGDVMTLPSAEVVQGAQAGASAATLPGTGALPKTTPLGAEAVHATTRGKAAANQEPVRTTRGKGGK